MAGRSVKGKVGFQSLSKVVAEFVDEIPEPVKKTENLNPFEAQPGVKEALQKAYEHPGHAMVLVEYTEGSPSRRRNLAEKRAWVMGTRGYGEENGWTVRAVEGKVYVLYTGRME